MLFRSSIVVDPYTNESSWILPTAVRVLHSFQDADVRVNFIVASDRDDARTFLGPIAKDFLVFTDPERTMIASLGLERLPAFVFIRHDGVLAASAEGWDPKAWRKVSEAVAKAAAWTKPNIPVAGDPAPFTGSPALLTA